MQTVNFQCNHCGKQMAVGTNLLGQQVRCPHCRQVVMAPAAMPAPSAPLTPAAAPDPGSTNPFGGTSQGQFETEGAGGQGWPNMQLEGAAGGAHAGTGQNAETSENGSGLPGMSSFSEGADSAPSTGFDEAAASQVADSEWSAGSAAETEPESAGGHHHMEAPVVGKRGGMTLALLMLIFLLPYASLMTCATIYFYRQAQRIPKGLEAVPDLPSDGNGAHKQQGSFIMPRLSPDEQLSDRLHVALGQTLAVGDLEATPEKIELRRITYSYQNSTQESETPTEDALVLTLRLKNISSDVYFAPADPAFFRMAEAKHSRPYTMLEVGSKHFFGGACEWKPRDRDKDPLEYIQGQDFHELKPGEQLTTIVCTDPNKPEILQAVHQFTGTMTWRVQLRRGLVSVRDREVSACAVIGVDFSRNDIRTK